VERRKTKDECNDEKGGTKTDDNENDRKRIVA
jgi:hypothetical protein